MKLTPWLVVLCMGLVACSGSKSAQKVDEEVPQIELSDADEFIENPVEEPVLTESYEEPIISDAPIAPEAPVVEDTAVVIAPEEAAPVVTTVVEAGTEKQYTVQKNETLMLIAFKLYGDYEKWKELANYNSDKLNGATTLKEGMVLRYSAPADEFVWNPEGLPYLIRTGDTLGLISNNVYQTTKKWKLLWENNRPLIKDPNKIFAGFTIYYPESGREVASEL
jgi:nucleoid-associated protein YgaU